MMGQVSLNSQQSYTFLVFSSHLHVSLQPPFHSSDIVDILYDQELFSLSSQCILMVVEHFGVSSGEISSCSPHHDGFDTTYEACHLL